MKRSHTNVRNGGIDMSMVPNSLSFSDHLMNGQREKVPMTRIDDAVRRILRVNSALGFQRSDAASDVRAASVCRNMIK